MAKITKSELKGLVLEELNKYKKIQTLKNKKKILEEALRDLEESRPEDKDVAVFAPVLNDIVSQCQFIKEKIEKGGTIPDWAEEIVSETKGKIEQVFNFLRGEAESAPSSQPGKLNSGKEIEEKHLSGAESKEKERIVKGIKKKPSAVSDMKSRYGKKWKSVAYATATKRAEGK